MGGSPIGSPRDEEEDEEDVPLSKLGQKSMMGRKMSGKASIAWADDGKTKDDGDGEGAEAGASDRAPSFFQRLTSMFSRQSDTRPSTPGSDNGFKRHHSSLSMIDRGASNATEAINASMVSGSIRLVRAAFFSDDRMEPDATTNPTMDEDEKVPRQGRGGVQRYTLRHLQARVYSMQRFVMTMALLGLASGIAVNEWCWLGYIPTPEEEQGYCSEPTYSSKSSCQGEGFFYTDGIPNPMKGEDGGVCGDGLGLFFKGFTTFITAILLIAVFHLYEVVAIELNMRNHLEYHKPYFNLPFWELGLLPGFIGEFFACVLHPVPGVVFFINVEARGRLSVYNFESWGTALMFVRMYSVWRYFREWLFTRYTSKHFASRMNDVPMDSKLALKAILEDKPFETIFLAFLVMTLMLAYLVRICESPVNIEHIYFWNQLWLIVVTATSTGYGDIYPLSHVGRAVCVFAMLGGIALTAILISAVSSKLALNAGESRLMNFLQSENWEKEIRIAGCRCIQSWWRRSILHPQTLSALRDFKNKRKSFRKFLEATPHFGAFVETIKDENTEIKDTLAKIELSVAQRLPTQDAPMGMMAGFAAANSKSGKMGARGAGGGSGKPMASNAFEQLMLEVANLRKANEQLQKAVDSGAGRAAVASGAGGASAFLSVNQAGAFRPGGAAAVPVSRDAATVASKAVEERTRRLEAQVQNLDKGMAKCLGQIVRLLQGLY